jgi:hypothetical protein
MLDTLMSRVSKCAIVLLFAVVPAIATAQILLFDIEANPKAWAKSIAGLRVLGSGKKTPSWDLSTLPDFGVSSLEGPLTSAGGGPIPLGFLPSIVQIDSSRFFPSEPITLAFIGPSANGYGNTENAIVPNQAQDSFDILFSIVVGGFEFDAISCSECAGSLSIINITVLDDLGTETVFESVAAPSSGHLYGLVGKNGRRISAVNFSNPGADPLDPNHYNPGIQGAATVFASTKKPHKSHR